MSNEEVSLDEAWETETGLLDEYQGTVTRAWFATDARYNDGNTVMLHLEIATNDQEFPEVTEKFPCGSGWDSRDGGETIEHEAGKQKFNKNSIYGKIVDRVTKPDGVLHDAFTTIKGRGRPTKAGIWEGLTFQFKREEFNYGGDIGTRSRVMPVKFLGENAQASTGADNVKAETAPSSDIDPVVAAKLRKAASEAGSQQEFVDAAMAIDGVVGDDDLLAQIVDDSDAGFYAQNS